MTLVFGCCVGSWDRVDQYVRPYVDGRPFIGMDNQSSITDAYNRILDLYFTGDMSFVDGLVLLHDDLEVTDPNADIVFMEALSDPEVALVGVAGGKNVNSLAWWNHDTVGHQMTDSGMLTFNEQTGDVDSLEGSIIVFSPWAIRHLRFDLRFTGFHGYDDISMIARSKGKRVVVADVDTHHHTNLGFKSPTSAQEWDDANCKFRAKWDMR